MNLSRHAERTGADWLSGAGLRPTRQRLALAALLVGDGQHRHVTAESLYDAARRSGEKVSLATVYNTLRAFCEAGLMSEITVDLPAPVCPTRATIWPGSARIETPFKVAISSP